MALILSLENLLHIPVINSSGDALCVELWPKPFWNRILVPMFGIRFFSFLKPAHFLNFYYWLKVWSFWVIPSCLWSFLYFLNFRGNLSSSSKPYKASPKAYFHYSKTTIFGSIIKVKNISFLLRTKSKLPYGWFHSVAATLKKWQRGKIENSKQKKKQKFDPLINIKIQKVKESKKKEGKMEITK